MPRRDRLSFICLAPLALSLSIWAAEADAEQTKFFEMKIRPLLINHCFDCHAEKKQKGALRLDSIQAILKGGQTGPALVPGKPETSLLITAVSGKDEDLVMPPKEKLSAAEVDALTQWIKMGAPWPKDDSAQIVSKKQKPITDGDRAFWSFQPLKNVAPPTVEDAAWRKNPIDAFIFAKLKAEGLSPAPAAEKAALIRRATYDLHGLPPTPAEIDAFLADASPDAYDTLIERLLASPRYGERWARHWLDLVRYAESDGFRQDAFRPHAWPYRDYVIQSFNSDKPYDRFITEQLAGDEIAPDDPNVLVATGFLRHGMYEYNQRDVIKQWGEILNDITDVTGDVFLGLSMGCARCHDHKFDPILQADYFKLQAFFGNLFPREDLVLATSKQKSEYKAALEKWEQKTAPIREGLAAIEKPHLAKGAKGAIDKFLPELQEMLNKPVAARTPFEHQIASLAYRQVTVELEKVDGKIKGKDREQWAALQRQLAEFDTLKPQPLPVAFVATDVGPVSAPTFIPGDKRKTIIEPGLLTVLGKQTLEIVPVAALPTPIVAIPGEKAGGTGRRSALAKWLTRPENPLTTRVIANRIWQYHFGRGLVSTSSDYGRLGDKPSHPELLDYLASQFVKDGWSFKTMHRRLMTSATYRQSALRLTPVEAKLKDPENRWLWRMPTRRLDAEQIRDAILTVSGELTPQAGGPSVDATAPRRSIYTKIIRNTRDPIMDAFDAPDAFGSAPNRNNTTTATQSLLMINGAWPIQRAEGFSSRLRQLKAADNAPLVTQAYRIAFGRAPTNAERDAALAFLKQDVAPAQTQVIAQATEMPPFKIMPHVGGQAAMFREGRGEDQYRLGDTASLPSEDFTIEAVVLLESLYDSANVRVIATQWSGNQTHPGWSFGVTSEKSKHQPRNLILQIVGKEGYEVVPSDLRIELHKTYYLGVSVKIKETGEAGMTFFMKDLSDPDATLRFANVKHKTTGGFRSTLPFGIGGRDNHGWDGLIDEVRLSRVALNKDQLLIGTAEVPKNNIAGHWRFEDEPGFLKDSTGYHKDLTRQAPATPAAPKPASDNALIDFCHILLNANEFLYVD